MSPQRHKATYRHDVLYGMPDREHDDHFPVTASLRWTDQGRHSAKQASTRPKQLLRDNVASGVASYLQQVQAASWDVGVNENYAATV